MTPKECIDLSRSCAARVYGTRPPSARYAEDVSRLLMGTAATESLLHYRRQIGFNLQRLDGAWGLWQTEQGAVSDSIIYLRRRGDVLANAARFVNISDIFDLDMHGLLMKIHTNDKFACLMARLHYLRVSESIPHDVHGQAGYWKRYYNTRAGKGTVSGYVEHWHDLIEKEL